VKRWIFQGKNSAYGNPLAERSSDIQLYSFYCKIFRCEILKMNTVKKCHLDECYKPSAGFRHLYCIKCNYTNFIAACSDHFFKIVVKNFCRCNDKVPITKLATTRAQRRPFHGKSASFRIGSGLCAKPNVPRPFFHPNIRIAYEEPEDLQKEIAILKDDIIGRIYDIDKQVIMKRLKKFKSMMLEKNIKLSAQLWTQTFIDSYEIYDRRPNDVNRGYDPLNDVYGCDILHLCYERVLEEPNFIYRVGEELDKIPTSHNRHGRFSRLIKLLVSCKVLSKNDSFDI
jgi:hypothetical protein